MSLRTDKAGSQVMDGMPPKSDHQPRQFTGGRFQSGQSRIRDTKDRWNQRGGKAGSGISGEQIVASQGASGRCPLPSIAKTAACAGAAREYHCWQSR